MVRPRVIGVDFVFLCAFLFVDENGSTDGERFDKGSGNVGSGGGCEERENTRAGWWEELDKLRGHDLALWAVAEGYRGGCIMESRTIGD